MSELFITLSSVSLNKGSACLSSFVGIGSSRHVDDFDERIRELSSGRSVGAQDSRSAPGCGGDTGVAKAHFGRVVGAKRGRNFSYC